MWELVRVVIHSSGDERRLYEVVEEENDSSDVFNMAYIMCVSGDLEAEVLSKSYILIIN